MPINLVEKLNALNTSDPAETAGLVDMYVYDGANTVLVGCTHEECLPAFQKYTGTSNALFDQADNEAVIFSSRLQDFEARTAALRTVIDEIDQNADILEANPTKYSLDDYRPIPQVSNPLLAISRPYCRKGFSVPTDCGYMIIQRENGDILFTARAEKIGVHDDATGADNYAGQFDIVGGAHVFYPETASLGATEVYFDSLAKRANQKVGITAEDVSEVIYTGTTDFQHTRGSRVFHHERHQSFLVKVSNDWQPPKSGDDVAEIFWASPEEAVKILQDLPVQKFTDVTFNNNARAAAIMSFMSPQLAIITPASIGEKAYAELTEYYADRIISPDNDPVLLDLTSGTAPSVFTAPELDA